MPDWTHNICEDCYADLEPGREPVRVKDEYRDTMPCCWCGKENRDGIYYRENPSVLACAGVHDA